jgi:hypothetical protein
MADDEIFCTYEMRSFPAQEFKTYPEYGVVHERPSDGGPRHTTSGQPLPSEEGAPETWTVPSQAFS